MVINLNLTHKNTSTARAVQPQGLPRRAVARASTGRRSSTRCCSAVGEPWQQGAVRGSIRSTTSAIAHAVSRVRSRRGQRAARRARPRPRGADGMRLMPSGEPSAHHRRDPDSCSPSRSSTCSRSWLQQWAEIGVEHGRQPDRADVHLRAAPRTNDHDAAVWGGQRQLGAGRSRLRSRSCRSTTTAAGASRGATGTSRRRRGRGAAGVGQGAHELYDQAQAPLDLRGAHATLIQQIADIAADEFEVFAISKAVPTYGIVKDDLRNVPAVDAGDRGTTRPGADAAAGPGTGPTDPARAAHGCAAPRRALRNAERQEHVHAARLHPAPPALVRPVPLRRLAGRLRA